MKPAYIFDLDGTLFDITHRLGFIKGAHIDGGAAPDWDAFHDAIQHDQPIVPVAETARILAVRYPLIAITGRRAEWRDATLESLRKHDIPISELHMRPPGDFRPDFEIKRELYEKHVAPRPIIAVYDDRSRVVQMWRSLGLHCFQVAQGDY